MGMFKRKPIFHSVFIIILKNYIQSQYFFNTIVLNIWSYFPCYFLHPIGTLVFHSNKYYFVFSMNLLLTVDCKL